MVQRWQVLCATFFFLALNAEVYARAPFGYVLSGPTDQMSPSWRPASRSFWSSLLGRDDAMQMRKRAYLRLGKRSGYDTGSQYPDFGLA